MSAPFGKAQLALDAHLKDFATELGISVKWENNSEFEAPVGAAWLDPTMMTSDHGPAALGPVLHRSDGIYHINLFSPEGEGTAAVNLVRDALIDHFQVAGVVTSGGVTVQITKAYPKNGRPDGHGFWMIPVLVFWRVWS